MGNGDKLSYLTEVDLPSTTKVVPGAVAYKASAELPVAIPICLGHIRQTAQSGI
jgi:hypothetical protein